VSIPVRQRFVWPRMPWDGAIERAIQRGYIIMLEDTDDYPMVIPVHDWAVELEGA
jgi:hypothetical protein